MIPFAAPPPPKPAQQIVINDARTNAQPATVPNGTGGRRTFANRHERRHYESDLRRAARRQWRAVEGAKLTALLRRHAERLSLARDLRAIQDRAASFARRTPASA